MKRIKHAAWMSFLILAILISGCSGGKSASNGTPGTDTPSGEDNAKKPVTLTLWVTSREQDDFTAKQEKAFLDSHPHITLNKVVKEGDPGNEFYQGVAAGNAPDLIGVSFTMMDKYMKAGILEPLNPYTEKWDEWKNFSKEYVDMFTVKDQIYGVPSAVSPMLFGYNKSLLEKAGVTEPPATWNDALEIAKKVNDPANQVAGYATLTAEWTEWFFQYYVWQAGGDLTKQNEDGTIELTFTDPAVIEAAEYYKKLRASKVLQSDLTLKFNDLVEKFAQGKIAMMPFAGDWVSWAVSLGMDPEDIGLSLPPVGPSGTPVTAIGGTSWVINSKTTQEQKDAAWEYIKYYSSKDTMIETMKNTASKGSANPTGTVREDIKIEDYYKLPEEYYTILEQVKTASRLEFYGKAELAPYVDRAVQKILIDPNADPLKELQAAQKLAETEIVKGFNEKIKNP